MGRDEAGPVIADGGVAVDRYPRSREPPAKLGRVGVHETPEQYFGPDRNDFGARQASNLHTVSPTYVNAAGRARSTP